MTLPLLEPSRPPALPPVLGSGGDTKFNCEAAAFASGLRGNERSNQSGLKRVAIRGIPGRLHKYEDILKLLG